MVILGGCRNDGTFREEQTNEFDNCLILGTTLFAFNNSNCPLKQRFIQFFNDFLGYFFPIFYNTFFKFINICELSSILI